MFRYIILGILIYWIVKRVFRVTEAVKQDKVNAEQGTEVKGKPKPRKDNHGGEYVDYKEVD
jgi:hypothetical protein